MLSKKYLIIFNIMIFLATIFAFSFVQASNEDETINFHSEELNNDFNVILPSGLNSNYTNYFILISDTKRYPYIYSICLLCSNDEFVFDFNDGYSYNVFGTKNNMPFYSFSRSLREKDTSIDFSSCVVDWENTSNLYTQRYSTTIYSPYTISANTTVYNLSNQVVFQAPPQQVEEQETPQPTPQPIQRVTIPAIQQVEEIPQGMSQVLQVIIPIGLIVLSIGLVVYLMRLVIYRMQS